VLCADPSDRRLRQITRSLRGFGLSVLSAHSASQCLALAAEHQPQLVILDADLLQVDYQDIAEYIRRVCTATRILLAVDDAGGWPRPPLFIEKVIRRGDYRAIVELADRTA
jgi:CheY-like chemotaxis protein